jgi:hemerythrin-like metal-binding protein
MRTAIHSGNIVIDADHERLSLLIREAVGLWMSKVPAVDFDAKLGQIHDVLVDHFHNEETILRASHFKDIVQHHANHEGILAQIDEMMAKLYGEGGSLSRFKIIDRLEAILFEHEMVEDGDYITHLLNDRGKLNIEWSDKYEIGVATVDNLHLDFVHVYNKLAGCIAQKNDKEDILDAMVELYDFAVTNFPKEEEIIANKFGRIAFVKHSKVHREFLNRLDDIVIRYTQDDVDAKASIGGYLRYLLLDHLETGTAEIITTA